MESLASRFEILWPHLSERQRRLRLGAEARELDPGGVGIVARAVGVAGDTVRRGRMELQEPLTLSYPRSRRPGGGRKRAEAGDPASRASMAKRSGLSKTTIGRIWKALSSSRTGSIGSSCPRTRCSWRRSTTSSTSTWIPARAR